MRHAPRLTLLGFLRFCDKSRPSSRKRTMHVCSEGLAKAAMPEMEFPRRRRRWSSSRAGLLGRPARATGVAGAAAVLRKPRTASRSTGDQKFQRFAGTCGCRRPRFLLRSSRFAVEESLNGRCWSKFLLQAQAERKESNTGNRERDLQASKQQKTNGMKATETEAATARAANSTNAHSKEKQLDSGNEL